MHSTEFDGYVKFGRLPIVKYVAIMNLKPPLGLRSNISRVVHYEGADTISAQRCMQFDASARSIQRKLFLNYLLMTVHIVFLSALY